MPDGGGELTGMVEVDPADLLVIRRALLTAYDFEYIDGENDAFAAEYADLYLKLGGDPKNLELE